MTHYNRLLCVDVEMTCWEGEPPAGEVPEMIAIGIVDLRTDDLEIRREQSFLIRPQFSVISPFCSTLTGITPKEAAAAPPLETHDVGQTVWLRIDPRQVAVVE